uniref:ZP domain-containing protein n=1 Tax=Trichuris muris TaxID=70415 RepID=A0A5S6QV36_TRIMR
MHNFKVLLFSSLCYVVAGKVVFPGENPNDPNRRQSSESGSVVQRFWVTGPSDQQNQILRTDIICKFTGINFTIHTAQPYTGRISIRDKFIPCQKYIHGENSFWYYVPASSETEMCAASIEDNEAKVTVVLYNDRSPAEIAKREIIYQICCPLAESIVEESVAALTTIVNQTRKKTQERRYARLRILRGKTPVDRIFIGETVILSIEADNDAEGIFIESCSVAPTNTPSPNVPVAIIKDGCSLMPEVVSNFRHAPDHLQASFTAFNINSTSALLFECIVNFCGDWCPQVLCQNETWPNFFRGKRIRRNRGKHNGTLNMLHTLFSEHDLIASEREDGTFTTQLVKTVEFAPVYQQFTFSTLWKDFSIVAFVLIFILAAVVCALTTILLRKAGK